MSTVSQTDDRKSAGGFPRLLAFETPTILRTLFGSLNPKTEIEAEIVGAQLDLLRTSFRLFDYTLPLAGAIIFLFQRFDRHGVIAVWWAVLCLTCIANEIILTMPLDARMSIIERARYRAWRQVALCLVFSFVWSAIAVLLWNPAYAPNMMFVEFILCCTLAAIATMASLHVASSVIPLLAVSAGVLVVPLLNTPGTHAVVIGIAIIFVALMLSQAWMIHLRTVRMLRLESERTGLIDSLRRAKEESDEARAGALEASRAKSEFLANMSHELRTPLNAIIGFSDIVKSQTFGDAPARYSEYGGFINQSGHHLLDLIGDILELAKIEAGRKKLQKEPIDLMSLAADGARRFERDAMAKGVALTTKLPPSLPLLEADLQSVRQIIANLLSNAVKFTPPDGDVELSVTLNAENGIELCVSDTGTGIALEDRAHLFDRLGHSSPQVTSAQRGSGLGLPIVKGLTEMHGAEIRLETELGEGTRIAIVFPASSTLDSARLTAA